MARRMTQMADESEAMMMQGNHEPSETPAAPWVEGNCDISPGHTHQHYTRYLDEMDFRLGLDQPSDEPDWVDPDEPYGVWPGTYAPEDEEPDLNKFNLSTAKDCEPWEKDADAFFEELHRNYMSLDESDSTFDVIEKPRHYNMGQFEVVDIIEDKLTADQFLGYCMGNVYKYTMRFQYKGGVEDLAKARWYLDRAINTYASEN